MGRGGADEGGGDDDGEGLEAGEEGPAKDVVGHGTEPQRQQPEPELLVLRAEGEQARSRKVAAQGAADDKVIEGQGDEDGREEAGHKGGEEFWQDGGGVVRDGRRVRGQADQGEEGGHDGKEERRRVDGEDAEHDGEQEGED